MLAGEARCNPKPGKPGLSMSGIDQDIRWLDVSMDQTLLVSSPHHLHHGDRNLQKLVRVQGLLDQLIQELAAGVLEHKSRTVPVLCERNGPCGPIEIELSSKG